MTKRALVLLPVLFGVLLLMPQTAEAQYYGRGYHGGGYGYGPRPMFDWKHRVHGYLGGQLTGIATVGQTASESVRGVGVGGYLGGGGGGGGLFGGVRLGPFFSLELNWNITWHQSESDYWGNYYSAFTLQTVELNGKIHIPTRGIVEPFVQAGVGFAFLGASYDDYYSGYGEDWLLASGVAFNVGGGLDVWLSPFLSLGGRLLYKGMRFNSFDIANLGIRSDANFASAVNVDLNLIIHF